MLHLWRPTLTSATRTLWASFLRAFIILTTAASILRVWVKELATQQTSDTSQPEINLHAYKHSHVCTLHMQHVITRRHKWVWNWEVDMCILIIMGDFHLMWCENSVDCLHCSYRVCRSISHSYSTNYFIKSWEVQLIQITIMCTRERVNS